jgi:CHAT domain-containing protein/Tfp pilus assembly protein PilF
MRSAVFSFFMWTTASVCVFASMLVSPPETEDNNLADSSRIYNNLGIESYNAGDFERAGDLFRRSLDIKRQAQGDLSSDMANTYSNLGAVSRRINQRDEAMQYYDTAGYIFVNSHGPDYARLGAVYQNQGNILRDQMDYNSALSYYYNALRIFITNGREDWAATLYNNLGIVYSRTGERELAMEYFNRSIGIRQKVNPLMVLMPAVNLANFYRDTGEADLADRYYRMSLEALLKYAGDDHPNLAPTLLNYGIFLAFNYKEPDRGYEMMAEALDIFRANFGYKGHQVALTLMNMGNYYQHKGNLDAALEHYQNALVANSETFNSTNLHDNPGIDDHAFSIEHMLTILKEKAYAFYLKSAESNRRYNLESSLLAYKEAINVIDMIRAGYLTEDSRIIMSENEHESFLMAIHIASELYRMTGDNSYLNEAFYFSEKNKAASLLASIRNVEARSFGGVPEELLENELDIKRGISAYRELIYEEQRNINADPEKIDLWQEKVFALEHELRSLIEMLEQEYPDYYALKYDPGIISVAETMNMLHSRDAVVSYTYNDTILYIFTITSKTAELSTVTVDGSPERKLNEMLEVLTNGNLDRRVGEDFQAFTGSAGYFFDLLINPVISHIQGKRLVIVPDGMLSYIPFELLLTSGEGLHENNYKTLPYLLRDFTISYSFSVTLWKESLSKSPQDGGSILAVAPEYEFSGVPSGESMSNRQYYRERLMPLPGARDEAVSVAGMMDGNVLLDNDATEYNFKSMAGDYNVLHLAMHTLIDDENPMFSKLVFSDSEDSDEDGLLNTYEVYNLNLNAGLAVLSACRSGYGSLNRGEGVMSLARGFLYAGVPSIVMTNWEVEDKSGAEIMIKFYSYLLKGHRKDEALRMARIDFLDNADLLRSHPYFWGAYVCIGNPEELLGSFRQYYPMVTFILLLMVMMLIIWRVQVRKN